MIKYEAASDIENRIRRITHRLNFKHVDLSRVACIRSTGSSSRRTVARCHAMGKIWQRALGIKAHYIIEVISERFDRMDPEEQTKTLIHELLHIPNTFGGGFRHHRPYVNRKTVESAYRRFKQVK